MGPGLDRGRGLAGQTRAAWLGYLTSACNMHHKGDVTGKTPIPGPDYMYIALSRAQSPARLLRDLRYYNCSESFA